MAESINLGEYKSANTWDKGKGLLKYSVNT